MHLSHHLDRPRLAVQTSRPALPQQLQVLVQVQLTRTSVYAVDRAVDRGLRSAREG